MIPSLRTSAFGKYEFVVRRVHSFTGLLPVGGYMAFHLWTNGSLFDGARTFQARVDQIHSLGPTTLMWIEWPLIFFPILFHAIVGMIIVLRGERNVVNYAYVNNFRYTVQRWTGAVALLFILYHVFQMHGWFRLQWWQDYVARPWGGALFDPHHAAASAAAAIQASRLVEMVYVVGVLACVYHFANGLWTFGITWGIWTSPRSQRWANYPCGAAGVLLTTVSLVALYSFETYREVPATAPPEPLDSQTALIVPQPRIPRPLLDAHPAGEM
jgi:succinate dehydrogenase / fumarate reductase, cytochrome b subunit